MAPSLSLQLLLSHIHTLSLLFFFYIRKYTGVFPVLSTLILSCRLCGVGIRACIYKSTLHENS